MEIGTTKLILTLPTISLKQTLQYGNEANAKYHEKHLDGLKQTLQYGNFTTVLTAPIFPSLKQTLQYGNEQLYLIKKKDTKSLKQTLQYGN